MTERMGSPSRRSIFTTSAPQSASAAAADGTKPCSEKSTILIPASGSVMRSRSALGGRDTHRNAVDRGIAGENVDEAAGRQDVGVDARVFVGHGHPRARLVV